MVHEGRDRLKELLRRYVDAGTSFSKMSRSELEDLLHGGGTGRERVEEAVEELRARSRRGLEQLSEIVRAEVHREFDALASKRRDEMGEFVEKAAALVGDYFGPGRFGKGRRAGRAETAATKAEAPAKKAAKKPAKKAGAKKPAKKAGAKKAANGSGESSASEPSA